MRKFVYTTLTLITVSLSASAQKIYVRGSIGYALPVSTQNMAYNSIPFSGNIAYTKDQSGNTAVSSFDYKNVSFNTGIQGQLGLGFFFTKNVGIDLGLNIGLIHQKYTGTVTFPSDPYDVKQDFTMYAQAPLIAIPALYIQSGGKKVNIYMRTGIAVPLKTRITSEMNQSLSVQPLNLTSSSISITEDIKTNLTIGFAGAAGIKYPIGNKIQFMAEISGMALSLYAREAELTAYAADGNVIPLSQIPGNYKTTTYGSSGGSNIEPSYAFPFSNVSVNAGICIDLELK